MMMRNDYRMEEDLRDDDDSENHNNNNHGEEEEEEDDDDEEEWARVSLDGEDEVVDDNDPFGTLILSGDEEGSLVVPTNEDRYLTVDDLDSVPTNVTLDRSLITNVAVLLVDTGEHMEEESSSSWHPNHEDDVEEEKDKARKHSVVLLVMMSALLCLVAVGWAWSLQISHMRLEQQMSDYQRLQDELRVLKESQQDTKTSCKENNGGWKNNNDDDDTVVLADNCYFKLSLRDCGKNVKQSWNEWTDSVYGLGKTAWNVFVSEEEEETTKTAAAPYNCYIKMSSMATNALSEVAAATAITLVNTNQAIRHVSDTTREAVRHVWNEMNIAVDESILRVVEMTRDAVDDATAPTRPEE